MAKKKFDLEGLECANCAIKMEDAIKKIDGVNNVRINFMSEKLIIDVDENSNIESVLEISQKEMTKIERGCKIVR